jgi:hypothetical protein
MTPGEIKGLATFICSMREDWQPIPVRAALEKLEKYSPVDVAEVCTVIALDASNQYPVMLSMKGVEMIRAKHEGKGKPRSTGNKLPDQFKCDVCGKVRSICQSAANNLNGSDHAFVSAAERNQDRDEMHADGRISEAVAVARAKALDRATRGGMFALPADVTQPQHPEPEQESA